MLGLRASGRSRGYVAPGGERGVGGWGWIRGGVSGGYEKVLGVCWRCVRVCEMIS